MADLSAADFQALHERLRAQVPWGAAGRRGALNHITPARVATAVTEARLGRTVTLAAAVPALDWAGSGQMVRPCGNESKGMS